MAQRINISALHRHVNDHNDKTTHDIVRDPNIGSIFHPDEYGPCNGPLRHVGTRNVKRNADVISR
jgi:hypothetical protein